MAETPCEGEIAYVAGHLVDIRKNFIHAPMLYLEHHLKLLVRKRSCCGDGPIAVFDQDFHCHRVVRVKACIAQSGVDLMQGVPRHACVLFPTQDGAHEGVTLRKGGEKTCFAGDLAVAQLGNDVVGTLLEADILRGTVHKGAAREVVSESVPLTMNLGPRRVRFPSAIDLRLGWQTGVDAQGVKHPVWLEAQQVLLAFKAGFEERTIEELHVAQRKWGGRPGHGKRWRIWRLGRWDTSW